MLKQGRRGSFNGIIRVRGMQGHTAYPERFINPITGLLAMLNALKAHTLDNGNALFGPSNFEITSIDVGNPAHNVAPETAMARFNIRFNTEHTGASLTKWIEETCAKAAKDFKGTYALELQCTGEAFVTPLGAFTDLVRDAAESVTGRRPEQSTSGGTSDARFFKDYAEVLDFGLVGTSMHKIDENVPTADIVSLSAIYRRVLDLYFERFAK
jgi:succinyl-diaminopimelate desuccinylase